MPARPDSPPRVSVIIPVFNTRPYLAEMAASLRAQDWPDLEVLIVDDGSTDGSLEYLESVYPEAIFLRQANRGPSVARNAGLARATGKYVTFLDSDDIWPAGKLARQVACLEADPALEAAMGLIQLFSDQPAADGGGPQRAWGTPFFLFLLGGMVCRRELMGAEGIGGFDEVRFPFRGEDTDWFFRAWEGGRKMEILEATTLYYRRRPGSLSQDVDDTKRSFPGLVMTSLRRRRGPDGRSLPLPNTLRIPPQVLSR